MIGGMATKRVKRIVFRLRFLSSMIVVRFETGSMIVEMRSFRLVFVLEAPLTYRNLKCLTPDSSKIENHLFSPSKC